MRLAATDLDQYLYWKRTEQPLEELLRRLRREEPPTEAMDMGRAFHTALELARTGTDLNAVSVDNFNFRMDDLDEDLSLPPIRELKAEWNPPGMPEVTIAMKCDGIEGKTVHEMKLTSRWDFDTYADSMQWRLYLLGFDADAVQYRVFVRNKKPGPDVFIYELHSFVLWRYPALEEDVLREVRDFVNFRREFLMEDGA